MHEDLNTADLRLLSLLPQYSSLRALARSQNLPLATVSRGIKSLEKALKSPLIVRSHQGYQLTPIGESISRRSRGILQQLDSLLTTEAPQCDYSSRFIIGSRGFLNATLAAPIIESLKKATPSAAAKFIDLSPKETMESARDGSLDLAVTLDNLDLGKEWSGKLCGQLEFSVFVGVDHPLTGPQSMSTLANYPMFTGAYWERGRVLDGADSIPDTTVKRQVGFQAQTLMTGVQILNSTKQFAWLPRAIVQPWVNWNVIRELPVRGLTVQRRDLWLFAHLDRVPQKLYSAIHQSLSDTLKDSD